MSADQNGEAKEPKEERPIRIERRKGDRRQKPRRSGKDRRKGKDRRESDRGPEAVGLEKDRRTGWDRRIGERREDQERRSGLDRRRLPTLHSIVIQSGRWLISRLYHFSKAGGLSQAAESRLAAARTEILKPRPDFDRVGKELQALKSTPVAKYPEYKLALDMLKQAKSFGGAKGGKASKRWTPLRLSLQRVPDLVAEPLEARVGKKTKKASKKTAKKKGKKKKATKGKGRKKTRG